MSSSVLNLGSLRLTVQSRPSNLLLSKTVSSQTDELLSLDSASSYFAEIQSFIHESGIYQPLTMGQARSVSQIWTNRPFLSLWHSQSIRTSWCSDHNLSLPPPLHTSSLGLQDQKIEQGQQGLAGPSQRFLLTGWEVEQICLWGYYKEPLLTVKVTYSLWKTWKI